MDKQEALKKIEELKKFIESQESMPEQEFKKGELVEVRASQYEPWVLRYFKKYNGKNTSRAYVTCICNDLECEYTWEQCRKYIPDSQFWVDIIEGQRPKYEGLALWDDGYAPEGNIAMKTKEFRWPWMDLKRFLPLDMAEYKRSIGRSD